MTMLRGQRQKRNRWEKKPVLRSRNKKPKLKQHESTCKERSKSQRNLKKKFKRKRKPEKVLNRLLRRWKLFVVGWGIRHLLWLWELLSKQDWKGRPKKLMKDSLRICNRANLQLVIYNLNSTWQRNTSLNLNVKKKNCRTRWKQWVV